MAAAAVLSVNVVVAGSDGDLLVCFLLLLLLVMVVVVVVVVVVLLLLLLPTFQRGDETLSSECRSGCVANLTSRVLLLSGPVGEQTGTARSSGTGRRRWSPRP